MSIFPASSKNRVPISVANRDKWASECVQYLTDNPNEYFSYSSSGDSIVFAFRIPDENLIEVYDAKIVRDTFILEDNNGKVTA